MTPVSFGSIIAFARKLEAIQNGNNFVAIDRDREGVYKIDPWDKVLKAPDDWDEDSESQYDEKYWLAKADELGI